MPAFLDDNQQQQLKTVTASDLGQFVFCAEAARLRAIGCRPDKESRERMAVGNVAHDEWQRLEDNAACKGLKRRALLLIIAGSLVFGLLGWWLGS